VSNKVALIVGAGSALGSQVARGLAAGGVRIALNDLLPNHIEPLAAALNAGGGQAGAFPADLSRKLALQTLLHEILEAWERIDILIFIPTVQPRVPLLDLDEWDWHRSVDLNLSAAFLCMQSVGRIMRQLGGGVMVNALEHSLVVSPIYEAAAAGLAALTRAASAEFGAYNIRLHALAGDHVDAQRILDLCRQEISPLAHLQ
jgi:NAD(P)-dependent dehydrogenase (short-subunit alcohol dehydrogenase family)